MELFIPLFMTILTALAIIIYDRYMKEAGRDDTKLRLTPDNASEFYQATTEQYWAAKEELEKRECEELTVRNGKVLLYGKLYRTKENNDKVILAVHGYHSGGMFDMGRFHKLYEELGYDYLIISQRAHEKSGGKYISFGHHEKEDGLCWINKILEIYPGNVQIVLHGVSMGAATVLLMAGSEKLPEQVRRVIADCSYTSMKDQMDHMSRDHSQFYRDVTQGMFDFCSRLLAKYSLADTSALEAAKKARIPGLIIHGEDDDYVPVEDARGLYEAYGGRHQILVVPGAGHARSYVVNPDLYDRKVKAFMKW